VKYIKLPKISEQKQRKTWYMSDSIKHPAKAHLGMMNWILKKFCQDGDVVLDPMCGIGTTLIEGMKLLPNSVFLGVEYEPRFVDWTNQNIKHIEKLARRDWFMKIGKAIVVQGDARELSKVLKEKVDKCIFSPPFGQAQTGGGIAKKGYDGPKHSPTDLVGKRSYMPENIGDKDNISNLGYGSVDKIVTSPPWGGKVQHKTNYLGKQKGESGFEYSEDPENLGNLPHGSVDKIITSPPYSEIRMDGGGKDRAGMAPYSGEKADTWRTQRDQDNIGNLPHGSVDKIITSPPYGEGVGHSDTSEDRDIIQKKGLYLHSKYPAENKDNIGNLKHGNIDKIITSPPYSKDVEPHTEIAPGRGKEEIRGYSENKNNIGNKKGKTYLNQMFLVYQECYKVLKYDGLMILITKNFVKNRKQVRLDEDTIKLCDICGFQHKKTYHRKIEHPSFWRTLYQQKYPQADHIDCEDIIVFSKGKNEN